MALTSKQKIFIDEYLKCFNATEAALNAGYSERSARQIGSENLSKPDIWEAISEHLKASAMSAEEILTRYADQARGDLGKFANIDSAEDLESHPLSRLVKKFKRTRSTDKNGITTEHIEIELYDAQTALAQIGRHWSLFTDKVDHSGSIKTQVDIVEVVRPADD